MNFDGKTVLVTGGTGSFGNYIVDRLLRSTQLKQLRILSRDEKKQYDMRIRYGSDSRIKFFIGDIRDAKRVDEVMHGVNIAYQAAALKHVGVCEQAPLEALKTNCVGVDNVIQSALEHEVETVVCVSTDKAVKPVNVMGMTKAIQERLMLSANLSSKNKATKLCVVRYGNVLLSRGSVVPFFRKLLAEGKKITITDERMTRFLLTLDDAIDLVMFATERCRGGETFVKKAPSAFIVKIAEVLAAENGKRLDYEIIGRLPGEKLDEVLITEEELERTVDKGDYFVVQPWWESHAFGDLKAEYASSDEIVSDADLIASLIRRADTRARVVDIDDGELSRV